MTDLYSFYHSLLNINRKISKEEIQKIVAEEKQKLKKQVSQVDGFCIFLASQIEARLQEIGVKAYQLNLFDIVGVDHMALIVEYNEKNEIKRILIDPTFEQFQKKENKILFKLKQWPSEKMYHKNCVKELLQTGICNINNDILNDYLSSFSDYKIEISLDELLLEQRFSSLERKKK